MPVVSAVPICEVGRRGRLDIVFGVRQGRTTIDEAYCEVPFKITRLLESGSDGMAHLILMQCSAGLFGGDTVECNIHVKAGSRVLITQQSATKVHPTSDARHAEQTTRIYVDRGGELCMFLDPIIPFAGSRLRQKTSIDVESGARVSYWESLMSGRIGRGESWAFEELSSETSLRLEGEPLFLDRFTLMPKRYPQTGEWAMGKATYLATGLSFKENDAGFADRLHDLLPGAGVDSPAPGLVVTRVVASEGPDFHRARAGFAAISRG
jgi:urease accessory protein UreH